MFVAFYVGGRHFYVAGLRCPEKQARYAIQRLMPLVPDAEPISQMRDVCCRNRQTTKYGESCELE